MNLEELEKMKKKPAAAPKVLQPDDIAPREEKVVPGKEFGQHLMDQLDAAIQRDKTEMYESVVKPAKEAMEEKEMFGDKGEEAYFEGDIDAAAPAIKPVVANAQIPEETNIMKAEPEKRLDTAMLETGFEDDELDEPTSTTHPVYHQDPKVIEPVVVEKAPEPEEETPVALKIITNPMDVKPEAYQSVLGSDSSDDEISKLLGTEDGETEEDRAESSEREESLIRIGYMTFKDDKEKEDYRQTIKKNISPFTNVINLGEYTVSKKPLATSKMLKAISETPAKMANWIFSSTGRPFTMSEFKGSEVEKLVVNDGNSDDGMENIRQQRTACNLFYKHIVDANKPSTFEGWMKTVAYEDFQDNYFGAYRACFSNDTNYVPYTCASCKHTFMDLKPLRDMVKFDDEETTNIVTQMIARDTTSSGKIEGSEMFQIANNIVVAVNKQSLYTVLVEIPALPNKLLQNYSEMVGIISHITDIYIVDNETKDLLPVDTHPVPGDMSKTVKNKYKVYFDIINSLSSDQYDYLNAIVAEFNMTRNNELAKKIKYVKPSAVCPKCGKEIGEIETSPSFLLFIRHRLQITPLS